MSHEATYREHLDLIDGVITLIARRNRLSAADGDDFRQNAHLKLLETQALARYEGRSSLRTYLTVVLQRVYLDYRTREWGKWRPSVEAQRSGPLAVLLERLIVRDGLTFDQALETIRTNHAVSAPREELERIAAKLPMRVTRKPQGETVLMAVPAGGPAPDEALSKAELQAQALEVRQALISVLQDLVPEERLIIKQRFMDGVPIVEIAALLKTDAKRLYRRIEQILMRLRRALEARGVDPERLFGDETLD